MLTVYIALFVTVLDQLVKWIVQQHMVWGESIPLISGVFHLTYIINPGAAFGILAYQRWFFLAMQKSIPNQLRRWDFCLPSHVLLRSAQQVSRPTE